MAIINELKSISCKLGIIEVLANTEELRVRRAKLLRQKCLLEKEELGRIRSIQNRIHLLDRKGI